eukprot:gene8135-12669_t
MRRTLAVLALPAAVRGGCTPPDCYTCAKNACVKADSGRWAARFPSAGGGGKCVPASQVPAQARSLGRAHNLSPMGGEVSVCVWSGADAQADYFD